MDVGKGTASGLKTVPWLYCGKAIYTMDRGLGGTKGRERRMGHSHPPCGLRWRQLPEEDCLRAWPSEGAY